LVADEQKIRASGMLHVEQRKFILSLEFADAAKMPKTKRHLWTQDNAWRLTGTVEKNIRFSCQNVTPVGTSSFMQFGRRPIHVQNLSLNSIELVSMGFSALSRKQRANVLGQEIPPPNKNRAVVFDAVFRNC